jgi:hypothetical protein
MRRAIRRVALGIPTAIKLVYIDVVTGREQKDQVPPHPEDVAPSLLAPNPRHCLLPFHSPGDPRSQKRVRVSDGIQTSGKPPMLEG